jgi:hypothetical protein
MRFDQGKLAPFLRPGITVGSGQLRMAMTQPGKGWQKVLEEILTAAKM